MEDEDMTDEHVRQRIAYLIEHGGLLPEKSPVSRRLVVIGFVVLGILQAVTLAQLVLN
jgi:hypothetical protein